MLSALVLFVFLFSFSQISSVSCFPSASSSTSSASSSAPRILTVPSSNVHNFRYSASLSSSLSPLTLHRLIIGFPYSESSLSTLASKVLNVSDPESAFYGRYYSLSDIPSILPVSNEHVSTVYSYFHSRCVSFAIERRIPYSCSLDSVVTNDYLVLRLPIALIESAFATKLGAYAHQAPPHRQLVRSISAEARIPDELASAVELVIGLVDFFDYPKELKRLRKLKTEERKRTNLDAVLRSKTDFAARDADVQPSSARSDKLHSLPKLDNSCGSNAPEATSPFLSESFLTPSFNIYCANGNATQNPTIPCSDYPPALQNLTIIVVSRMSYTENVTLEKSYTMRELSCSLNGPGQGVTCSPPPMAIYPWVYIMIYSFATYEDDSTSSLSSHPVYLAPSPYLTPSLLFDTYSIPTGTMGTNKNNSQAVIEFEMNYEWDSDLQLFQQAFRLPPFKPTIRGFNNVSSPLAPASEASTDLQLMMAIAQNITTVFWTFGEGQYMLDWALQVSNDTQPPLVTSLSFGDDEFAFYEKFGNSWAYVHRLEVEFQKMALRGLTVFVASGDAGVSNAGASPNDLHGMDYTCEPFRPSYPTTSPWVTGVSATFLTSLYSPICSNRPPGENSPFIPSNSVNWGATPLIGGVAPFECSPTGSGIREVAVGFAFGTDWTTGGGFSGLPWNTQPEWQQWHVQRYLNRSDYYTTTPPDSLFNRSLRAYPDLSAVGHNTVCVIAGVFSLCTGTSAASPIAAGVASLVNDALLNDGLPPVGFMNPLLYFSKKVAPSTWNRIHLGSNANTQLNPRCANISSFCPNGFHVLDSEFNPVTGLGTWNFGLFKSLLFGIYESQRLQQLQQEIGREETGKDDDSKHHTEWIGYALLIFNAELVVLLAVYYLGRKCYQRSQSDQALMNNRSEAGSHRYGSME